MFVDGDHASGVLLGSEIEDPALLVDNRRSADCEESFFDVEFLV